MKKYAKHKGFTLIELLIVVVIIGILAMMMMLASDEAKASARAAAIISDLESFKAAASAYYLDHRWEIENGTWLGFDPQGHGASNDEVYDAEDKATNELWAYVTNADGKKRAPKAEGSATYYKYSIGGDPGTPWFVWCRVDDKRVREKLQARQASVGLVTPIKQKGHNSHHSTATSTDSIIDARFVGLRIH